MGALSISRKVHVVFDQHDAMYLRRLAQRMLLEDIDWQWEADHVYNALKTLEAAEARLRERMKRWTRERRRRNPRQRELFRRSK